MKKNIIFLLLIILASVSLVSNTKVFDAYIEQQDSVYDMQQFIPRMDLQMAIEKNMSYPNINIYVAPFDVHLGRVYLRDSIFDKAIESFHRATKANPFLPINENYLAETYLKMNQKDSFRFYAQKIFNKMPNHVSHFAFYIKSLEAKNTSVDLDSAFQKIIHKDMTFFWKTYLAAIYNVKYKSPYALNQIKIADSLFPKDTDIQYIVAANRFGEKNIKKSNETIIVADKLAEANDFKGSIKVLKSALKLYPDNNNTFNKLATSYFKISKYDSSLHYINKININKFNDLGRYHLIKGINLANLDRKKEACNQIQRSMILKNKEAIKASRVYCN